MAGLFDLMGPTMDPSALLPLMAQEQAPGVPMMDPSLPAPAPGMSLLDRIRAAVFPVTGALMNNVLNPSDIAGVRRQALMSAGLDMLANSGPRVGPRAGLGQLLAHGLQTGQQTFQQGLQGALQQRVGMSQLAQQAAQQAEQMKKQQALDALGAKYAAQPGETPDETRDRLSRYVSEAITIDPDLAGKFNAFAPLFAAPKPTRGVTATVLRNGAPHSVLIDPTSGKEIADLGRAPQAQTNDYKEASLNNSMTKTFITRMKPIADRAALLNQAVMTIQDAAHNPNPAVRKTLYSSAVTNFIQAADQKAQLRYQLLQYFKSNVDASVAGRWNVLKERMLNGTLPQYSMDAMLTHLAHLRELTKSEYTQARQGEVSRHPSLDQWLPQASEYFDVMPDVESTSAGPGGYSPDNPFARRP